MKPLIQEKQANPSIVVALLFACFALLPVAKAVVPAPDGGYPGGNTAEGQTALLSLTTGGFNTAVGYLSLRSDTTNSLNTAVGAGTLLANTGDSNTATGAGALLSNTTGNINTADGAFALFSNTTGSNNTAVGWGALEHNSIGLSNTALGGAALFSNVTGNYNTALGWDALADNAGNSNTAVGLAALHYTTGTNNVALGQNSGINVTTANNVICIGAAGANVSDSFYVANVFETSIDPDNLPVLIDFTGRLGTGSSSRRFKDDITPMDKASESILALRPVTFHYKNDANCRLRFGLVAEDVAKVNSDLVVRDKEGKPYTVRYDQVNAMLLNEFLKEHRQVEEQGASITQLKSTVAKQEATLAQQRRDFEARTAQQEKEIQAFIANLKEQTAQIQKVSAQIEASKFATGWFLVSTRNWIAVNTSQ